MSAYDMMFPGEADPVVEPDIDGAHFATNFFYAVHSPPGPELQQEPILPFDIGWPETPMGASAVDDVPPQVLAALPNNEEPAESLASSPPLPEFIISGEIPDGNPDHAQQQSDSASASASALDFRQRAMEEFFAKNGARRPPEPCDHCRRLRLHCFILKTTAVNPNPVNSCSSCVALFRNCSLAERSKRNHSIFETAHPAIGQLHGVREEEDHCSSWNPASSQAAGEEPLPHVPAASVKKKRLSSRSVKKAQILRDWFSVNIQHPYPTDDEKSALAEQTGLTRTQIINWFTNARRRFRLSTPTTANGAIFGGGTPLPRTLLSSMTPFERWRNSPPSAEPVSEATIQRAISTTTGSDGPRTGPGEDEEAAPLVAGVGAGGAGGADDVSASSDSTDSLLWSRSAIQSESEGSQSSQSQKSARSEAIFPLVGSEDRAQPAWTKSGRPKRPKTHTFTCAYCSREFYKKYDQVRHERSIHAPGDRWWVCEMPLPPGQAHVVWRLGQTQAECIFCGQASPTEEHLQSHEFEACAERPVEERRFTRKDHMWQHLYKFHGCRRWEGWKPDLNLLMHKAAAS